MFKSKKEKKNSLLLNFKRTWKFIKKSKANLYGYVGASIFEAVISTISPLIYAKQILYLTDGVMGQLLLTSLFMLGLDCFIYFMYFFKSKFYQKIYQKTLIELQKSVAEEILKLETCEIDKNSTGLFIDRLSKDTSDISGIFMEYAYWISYILTNIGIVVTLFILNKIVFIYAIVTSILLFFLNKASLSKQTKYRKELKSINEEKTSLIGELVRGIRDVKVLNATDAMLKQTSTKIEESTNKEIKIMNVGRIYNLIIDNIRAISEFCFILLGCILFKYKMITIPTLLIAFNYQGRVRNLLTGFVRLIEYNKKFVVSADRVYEVIENDTFKKEEFGNIEIKKLEGNIKFNKVSFGYNKTKVIKDLSFEVKPNERVAFVGKSGSGKSTIFSLITKLYSVNKGEILLDGNNINDLTCGTIRDNMSIITQSPYIFNFTIKENLLLAKPTATMREMREACKLACIDDYIMSLPDKYNTMVGENGVVLSGGQKQRIAIARALLMKTEIILFDEATSALDNETQSKIQEAINNLQGEYTILIVAHRLSTVIDSDRIFVVDNGKIVDSGTHQQLLKNSSYYKKLYNKDLQK